MGVSLKWAGTALKALVATAAAGIAVVGWTLVGMARHPEAGGSVPVLAAITVAAAAIAGGLAWWVWRDIRRHRLNR